MSSPIVIKTSNGDILNNMEVLHSVATKDDSLREAIKKYQIDEFLGSGAFKQTFGSTVQKEKVLIFTGHDNLHKEMKLLDKMKEIGLRTPEKSDVYGPINCKTIFICNGVKQQTFDREYYFVIMERLHIVPTIEQLHNVALDVLFCLEHLRENGVRFSDLQFMVDRDMNPVFIDPLIVWNLNDTRYSPEAFYKADPNLGSIPKYLRDLNIKDLDRFIQKEICNG